MKAIVCNRYGSPSVLVLRDVEKPTPSDDEVLIRVRASSINSRDDRRMRANPFFIRFMAGGLFRPKTRILGADAAGTIEAIGASVRSFKVGDEVFGFLKRHQGQCFAEYALAGEEEVVLKPAKLSFEQAAAVPLAALTALQALRDKGKLRPGEKVLIQGASGGVGSFAVQIAKALGWRSYRGLQRAEPGGGPPPRREPGDRLPENRFLPGGEDLRPDPRGERLPSLKRLPAGPRAGWTPRRLGRIHQARHPGSFTEESDEWIGREKGRNPLAGAKQGRLALHEEIARGGKGPSPDRRELSPGEDGGCLPALREGPRAGEDSHHHVRRTRGHRASKTNRCAYNNPNSRARAIASVRL